MNRWACQLLNRFAHPFSFIQNSGATPKWRIGGQRQSCRPMVETLEDRTMPSAAGLAILNSLHDTVIRAEAVKDYTRDGSLTRSDIIDIFGKAALEGTKILNTTELTDLHTIVSDYGPLGIPAYVDQLGNDVIGFNLANEHFQGKTLLAKGQLAAGNPGTDLTDLVDKWFLGQDLPAAVDAWGTTHTYAPAKGNLFGPVGPSYLNVEQGEAGDCYFVSSLAEIAVREPAAIRSMFIANGDGTYTVRFYEQVGSSEVAKYVTVNAELPVNQYGQFVFANMGQMDSSASNVLWVAMAEKAYAQFAELTGGKNSYATIGNGGYGFVALQQILGESTSWVSTLNTTTLNELIADLNAGDMVVLGSKPSQSNSNVIDSHEYYVTGYNASTHTFTVVNPWGANLATIGTLHLTAAQIEVSFDEYDLARPA